MSAFASKLFIRWLFIIFRASDKLLREKVERRVALEKRAYCIVKKLATDSVKQQSLFELVSTSLFFKDLLFTLHISVLFLLFLGPIY